MKRLCLGSSLILACSVLLGGCAGSGSTLTPARFAGTYTGTWVNTADATDAGTSNWTISSSGVVDGTDTDPGRATTFHVQGHIDAQGHLVTTSTPTGGSPASLDGTLNFGASNQISGLLVWGVSPPLSYHYAFTRQTP